MTLLRKIAMTDQRTIGSTTGAATTTLVKEIMPPPAARNNCFYSCRAENDHDDKARRARADEGGLRSGIRGRLACLRQR